VGAIIDGRVIGEDPSSGLMRVHVGDGEINVQAETRSVQALAAGARLRVQLLARDVIVSTRLPQYLSVRNSLRGIVVAIDDDGSGSDLVSIDIGAGACILARVTHAATRELALAPGAPAWALIKAVSLRGHSFPERSPPLASAAT
jgi:molybdate transport system ATP-binding protein